MRKPFDAVTYPCLTKRPGARSQVVMPDLIHQIVDLQGAKRVLDFGCGTAAFLADYPWPPQVDRVGYDINKASLIAARNRCRHHPNIQIVSSLSGDLAPFDAVTMVGVWTLLKDKASCHEALSQIEHCMNPDGRLYAVVTNPLQHSGAAFSNFFMGHADCHRLEDGEPFPVYIQSRGHYKRLRDNTHWSLRTMCQQLKQAKLKLVDVKRYPDQPPFEHFTPWVLLIAEKQKTMTFTFSREQTTSHKPRGRRGPRPGAQA